MSDEPLVREREPIELVRTRLDTLAHHGDALRRPRPGTC